MQDNVWQAVLGEAELSVSHGSYVTWFKHTLILQYDDDKLIVGVGNVFVKQQMEKKYNAFIMNLLAKNGMHPRQIIYKIHASAQAKKPAKDNGGEKQPDQPSTIQAANPAPASSASLRPTPTILTHKYRQGINERYTFDSFIVGSGNELAYAACQGVAASPGSKYNPLFLYGGVGIGKTHLVQAVGNAIQSKNPSAHVVYISIEQFIQEFIDAVRYKKNTDFAGYYRSADVLIIEDMEFISGKDKTQEEFFHTFNALHQANKQIIITSDRPPRDIPTLEKRLQSRFAWGMSIDMQIPDFETRCAIIQTKAQVHNSALPPDVVEYVANLFQSNIRELEGELNRLLAFCEMRNLVIDIDITKEVLGNSKRPKHLSAKQIVEKTARHFQIEMEDITGPRRDKDIVVPRQVAMYILRSELRLSFPKIAKELGRKDHTTAIHSVDKITREAKLDVDIRTAIQEIKEHLYV